MHKPLYRYAGTIKRNWENIDIKAKPYVDAMFEFDQIKEKNATTIVMKFLQTSKKWRGETARQIKYELKIIAGV